MVGVGMLLLFQEDYMENVVCTWEIPQRSTELNHTLL